MGTDYICSGYALRIATGIISLVLLLGFGGNICGASISQDIEKISLQPPRDGEYFGWSITSGDFNGDGLADVVVGNPFLAEEVYVYYGEDDFKKILPDITLTSPDGNKGFGFYVTSGDMNKDGFDDLAVAMNWGINKVYVYYGASTGLENTPDTTLTPPNGYPEYGFGHEISSGGDINGDGFSDLIIGVASESSNLFDSPYICVYYGSLTGISGTFYDTFEYPGTGSSVGVSTDGDFNADGINDIVVSVAKIPPASYFEVYIHYGSSDRELVSPQKISIPIPTRNVYNRGKVASAGDLNGDGFADLLIGHQHADGTEEMEGKAFIFYGSSSDLSSSPDVIIDNPNPQYNARFGNSLDGIGDFNYDGFDDIVIGCKGSGSAYIYFGSFTGVTNNPSLTFNEGRYFGWAASHVGDIKDTGQNFVIIGEENGGAYLYGLKDTTLPTISISSPTDVQTFTINTTTVSGRASDNIDLSEVEIKVNDGNWQLVSGRTSWSASVTLSEGENTISARAIDKAGNIKEIKINVFLDTKLPAIVIASPKEGQIVKTSSITVSGTVSDVDVKKVEVRLGTINWQRASGTSSWNASVTLSEGQNTISARAIDNAGNTKEITVNVILDTELPAIIIISPKEGEIFSTSHIIVSGTSSDDDVKRVEVGVGTEDWQTASGTSLWSASVTPLEGVNTICARAIDKAGNVKETTVDIIIDTEPPAIAIKSPKEGQIVKTSSITVSGTASDDGLKKVDVRTGTKDWQTASGTSSWNASVTLLEGSNIISARAIDKAGNIAEKSIIVKYNLPLDLEKIVKIIATILALILSLIGIFKFLRGREKENE